MKTGQKRTIISWLLLSVFVPMMVLSALHVHESDSSILSECSACVHHQAHPGHLTADIGHLHDCVLCQLMASTFLVASTTLLFVLTFPCHVLLPSYEARLATSRRRHYAPRGPPAR